MHMKDDQHIPYEILCGTKVFVTLVALLPLTIHVNISCFNLVAIMLFLILLQLTLVQSQDLGRICIPIVTLWCRCRIVSHPPFHFGYLGSRLASPTLCGTLQM